MEKYVIVFLADGFEEVEALTVVDLLRRAGICVTTASVMEDREVKGAHDIPVKADAMAQDVDYNRADLVVLPGGGHGTENLGKSQIVKEQCLAFADGKQVAAICAAPTVLAGLGLLENRKATCYPGMEGGMHGALMQNQPVVADGNITTGRAPGAAIPFALELIRQLRGEEAMLQVKAGLVW